MSELLNGAVMNIALTVSPEYLKYSTILLYSLAKNCQCKQRIFVLMAKIHNTKKYKSLRKTVQEFAKNIGQDLEYIYVNPQIFSGLRVPLGNLPKTMECYYRLMLHHFLPETLERCLYLEADMIVYKDIHKLYELDFQDNYFCAAPQKDCESFTTDEWKKLWEERNRPGRMCYINSGVLLINLTKFRNDNIQVRDYLQTAQQLSKDYFYDQQIISVMFLNKIKFFPSIFYNYFDSHMKKLDIENLPIENQSKAASIIHFTSGLKPWTMYYENSKNANYLIKANAEKENERFHQYHQKWWSYAEHSPFYSEFLREAQIKTKVRDPLVEQILKNESSVKKWRKEATETKKYRIYYGFANTMLIQKRKQILFYSFFIKNNYKKIAFYSASEIARMCVHLLKDSSVQVEYIMDENLNSAWAENVIPLSNNLPKVDIIIVAHPFVTDEMIKKVNETTGYPVVSYKDLLID